MPAHFKRFSAYLVWLRWIVIINVWHCHKKKKKGSHILNFLCNCCMSWETICVSLPIQRMSSMYSRNWRTLEIFLLSVERGVNLTITKSQLLDVSGLLRGLLKVIYSFIEKSYMWMVLRIKKSYGLMCIDRLS